MPKDSYLDLVYNYYHISSSDSTKLTGQDIGNLVDEFVPGESASLLGKASLKGQYHFAEFFFRTRIGVLNLLDQYFRNQVSLGFSFQNINLHHINNLKLRVTTVNDDGTENIAAGLAQKQKHKVFGFGPAFKWESELSLLPMVHRPHDLSFISEVKFALLFANYYAKGNFNLGAPPIAGEDDDGNATVTDISSNLSWRRTTDYLVVLNTTLKAGLRYTYKNFSFETAYKILYFSDEDYDGSSEVRGVLSEGIIPDLTNLWHGSKWGNNFSALILQKRT